MKSTFKRCAKHLGKQHKGVGGLYFIFSNIVAAVIMTTSLQLSWDSQVVAMADNLSYITSINTSAYSYISNVAPFNLANPSIPTKSGGTYKPLDDFNTMLEYAGISADGASSVRVTWDGNKATVQFGAVETTIGTTIYPHQQESNIESY